MKQAQALDILKMGHNVYLTGSAGSGKTFLLNQYIKYLKAKGVEVGITASTGIAATHMNGMTIHSWAGFGIQDDVSAVDWQKFAKKRYLAERLTTTKVLIIDEVSMLHAFQLDLVDKICRMFRDQPDRPFGGLQVILCGDFFQLPPVSTGGQTASFIHTAQIWQNMNLKICYLDEQHRHTDSRLVSVLNDIRGNRVSDETIRHLESRRSGSDADTDDLTKLYTHNVDVSAINERRLQRLPGETLRYTMRQSGNKKIAATLIKNCLAPEVLCLKIGAIVMFVKNNFDQGYVNGTLGEVIDFNEDNFPIVQTRSGRQIVAAPLSWIIEEQDKTKAEIVQIPLRLAWAITVHKSQGMSLDAAEMDLSQSFAKGMGYVALSRVCSLDGIHLKGFNQMALMVDEDISRLDEELLLLSQSVELELNAFSPDEKKLRQQQYLASIAPSEPPKKRQKKSAGSTYRETKALVLKHHSIEEIAHRRGMVKSTVLNHLEKLAATDPDLDIEYLKPAAERFARIEQAFAETGGLKLSPVRELLGDDFSYDELRLARLFLGRG
ncbi:AAA family ATPase [Candidatus Gottesmanbacteria bacterium]|nr:AAA family ATPase [Candidatus Gottesmanbacteria bacterium]